MTKREWAKRARRTYSTAKPQRLCQNCQRATSANHDELACLLQEYGVSGERRVSRYGTCDCWEATQ